MLHLVRPSAIRRLGLVLLSVFLGLNASCAKRDQKEEMAVKIGAYTLTASEFEELFHQQYEAKEDTPENRANFLNNLMTRKLLLEEAQRRGLDTQKDFLRSIENFWEQSLLRLVVDQKVKEIVANITVTEAEMEAYYQKWLKENPQTAKPLQEVRDLIEWRIRKAKEGQAMEEWNNGLLQRRALKSIKRPSESNSLGEDCGKEKKLLYR